METSELLVRLHEDLREIKNELISMRREMRDNMIDVAVLKARMGYIAAAIAIVAAAAVEVATRVFF